jgi:amino acid permease
MTKNRNLIAPAVLAGLVLLVVGVVYFVDSASSLPSFFPGHEAGSSRHHIKHGIAAVVVGVLAFVFAWFQTESPSARSAATSDGPQA